MNIKNIAKKAVRKRVMSHRIDLSECLKCRFADVTRFPSMHKGYMTHITCEIIGDTVHDDNYDCPKKDLSYRYCENKQIYCHKDFECDRCPFIDPVQQAGKEQV